MNLQVGDIVVCEQINNEDFFKIGKLYIIREVIFAKETVICEVNGMKVMVETDGVRLQGIRQPHSIFPCEEVIDARCFRKI